MQTREEKLEVLLRNNIGATEDDIIEKLVNKEFKRVMSKLMASSDADLLYLQFISDCVVPGDSVSSKDLHARFESWSGLRITQKVFTANVRSADTDLWYGVIRKRHHVFRGFKGIKLK